VTSVPASIARALIGGLKYDIPANDTELRALVPQRLLTFREAVLPRWSRSSSIGSRAAGPKARSPPCYRHDHAFYAKRAAGAAETAAPPAAVWRS